MSTISIKELSHPAGQVIKIASGKTLDLKSQGTTTLPTGSVLQTVTANTNTAVTTTSSTYSATGLTASITPTSTSSKILVSVSQNGVYKDGNNTSGIDIRLVSNGGSAMDIVLAGRAAGDSAGVFSIGSVSGTFLNSPNSTSSITYSTDFRAVSNTNTAYVQVYSATSSITLMEIQG